eukprot:scaffold92567_cov39-Phaeocystis_antarctica.AAC.1
MACVRASGWAPRAPPHLLCTYHAHAMHMPCIYHAYTMHIPRARPQAAAPRTPHTPGRRRPAAAQVAWPQRAARCNRRSRSRSWRAARAPPPPSRGRAAASPRACL